MPSSEPKAPSPPVSAVLLSKPEDPKAARAHFASKLSLETDPADVHRDLQHGLHTFTLVDVRSPKDYRDCHIPGAVNLPVGAISPSTVGRLDREKPVVVYCWGPGCNGATKAAAQLASLGFQVKEMIGGIEYWRREGLDVEGTLGDEAPLVG